MLKGSVFCYCTTGTGIAVQAFLQEKTTVYNSYSWILSIMDAFCGKYGKEPDLVISGFHLMKKTEYTGDEIKRKNT